MSLRRTALLTAALAVTVTLATVPEAFAANRRAATTGTAQQLLVQFRPGTSDATADEVGGAAGAAHIGDVHGLGVRVLRVPEGRVASALTSLRRNPNVAYAETDATLQIDETTPNDPLWSKQWALPKVQAPAAWDATTGDPSVVIAVLDTGVSPHADLASALVAGRDLVNGDADPADDHGHGTRMAGIAAARTNNGVGVAGTCGRCSVMPVKVMRADGSGSMSTVASGITWAVDHGARVISMSLSSSSGSSTLLNAVRYARDRGAVLVAAAGNNGDSVMRYPAAFAEVIAVAGTDANDNKYSSSNYGSWVEVAAPGCNYSTNPDGTYGSSCGTSAATPVVAGIAGLAAAARADATNTEIESAIKTGAVDVGDIVRHGRVDAQATLAHVGAGVEPEPDPEPPAEPEPTVEPEPAPEPTTVTTTFSGSLGGKQMTRSYTVATGVGEIAASLSFTRASSLTLAIVAADGTELATTSGASTLQLTASVPGGSYTVTVTGTKANFGLIVSHASA